MPYSTDLVLPVVVTVIGGLLLWVIIALIKIVVDYGLRIAQLEAKYHNLSEKLTTETAQYSDKIYQLEQDMKVATEDRIHLHQMLEKRLVTFQSQLDEKLDKIFDKLNDLREDMAGVKAKQNK